LGRTMKRREFIALLGSAGATWLLAARAQAALPLIGFFSSGNATAWQPFVAGFRKGLLEEGFAEGQHVRIEYRWGDGHYDRLPEIAAELVRLQPTVILGGGPPAAHALKKATTTIPIVFVSGDDPVRSGLVESLNHPGANVTGAAIFTGQLGAKQLGLLRELVPRATVVAMLVNPKNPVSEFVISDVRAAAEVSGHRIEPVNASNVDEIEKAFATIAELHADALIVGADPYFFTQSGKVVALAARDRVPAIYEFREFVEAGGLASYGASITDGYRQAGVYTGKILKGEKPADLPVLQPTKFELVINLAAVKALNLTLSPSLQATADEVIE
jgi:putative tryptophan/tyrosine transport system substrate-binding protein